MGNTAAVVLLSLSSFFLGVLPATAEIRPDKIRTADAKKTQAYLSDGMVVGGDKAINEVVVRDLRRAANPAGFERIVIDLEGNRSGSAVAIPRPPFFQVSVNADERRLVVTVFGRPKLGFDAKRVLSLFKKSPVVEHVAFYPVVDEDSWTFVLEMKESYPVEIFELTNPVRIILDVKTRKPAAQVAPSRRAIQRKKVVAPPSDPQSAYETEGSRSDETSGYGDEQ